MELGTALLLANAATAWFMTGLVWYAQVVHYPIFALVGGDRFPRYQASNVARTAAVVLPPMLVELASGIALAFAPWRPAGVGPGPAWTGLALLAAIWFTTAAVQAPLHGRLARGFDARLHRVVVVTNWIRTAAWSGRSLLALSMLDAVIA